MFPEVQQQPANSPNSPNPTDVTNANQPGQPPTTLSNEPANASLSQVPLPPL